MEKNMKGGFAKVTTGLKKSVLILRNDICNDGHYEWYTKLIVLRCFPGESPQKIEHPAMLVLTLLLTAMVETILVVMMVTLQLVRFPNPLATGSDFQVSWGT